MKKTTSAANSRSRNPGYFPPFFHYRLLLFPIIIIYVEEADKAKAQPITIEEAPSSGSKYQLERKCGVNRGLHELLFFFSKGEKFLSFPPDFRALQRKKGDASKCDWGVSLWQRNLHYILFLLEGFFPLSKNLVVKGLSD